MKTLKPIIFTAVGILLAASAFAYLPPVTQTINPQINPGILKTAVCTALENKIAAKINKYDENKGKHQDTYTKLVDRITQKVADWKAMGYNVSQVQSDLKTLGNKVKKFGDDYSTFIDKLKATQNLACGTDPQYKSALADAKAALKVVRLDVVDIRQYYWSTVRPDIEELKQQTPVVTGE